MADKTGIEWTDATWNPITGCAKVSAGCKHCYAERNWGRLQHLPAYAGRAFTDVATHADRLLQPLSWKRPRRIFVNSMSDLFHQDIHDDFIGMVFRTMARAPQHTYGEGGCAVSATPRASAWATTRHPRRAAKSERAQRATSRPRD